MNDVASTYKTLALAFHRPNRELLAGLRETEVFGGVLAEDVDLDSITREYTRIFSLTVAGGIAPYELEYGDPGAFSKTQRMADVAGFYQAFGMELAAQERVDYIGAELEFMQWMALKESRGREVGKDEQVRVCRDAAAEFMNDHLGRWAPFFGEQLALAARHPLYVTLGRTLGDFIKKECARLGVEPDVITLPAPQPSTGEFNCEPDCEPAESRTPAPS